MHNLIRLETTTYYDNIINKLDLKSETLIAEYYNTNELNKINDLNNKREIFIKVIEEQRTNSLNNINSVIANSCYFFSQFYSLLILDHYVDNAILEDIEEYIAKGSSAKGSTLNDSSDEIIIHNIKIYEYYVDDKEQEKKHSIEFYSCIINVRYEVNTSKINTDIIKYYKNIESFTWSSRLPLPLEIFDLPNLLRLYIIGFSYNNYPITKIPNEIGNLINLKELYIYNGIITELPNNMDKLKNLEILCVTHNQLKEIPNYICDLPSLKILDLSFNELTKLPNNIGNLKKLLKLNIGYNKITELPKSIENLTNLIHLCINSNQEHLFKISKLPLLII